MYDSDDDAIRHATSEVRRMLEQIESRAKGPRKVQVTPREHFRSKSHAAWLSAVQACIESPMTQNALITLLDVDIRTFLDWKEAKRQIPAWAVNALPEVGRVAYARALLVPSEYPSRTGTDG